MELKFQPKVDEHDYQFKKAETVDNKGGVRKNPTVLRLPNDRGLARRGVRLR